MPDIPKYSNQLIHETSPYLLQHAHNPVDWYPWGDEALDRAKKENRPILISIGYAACHWCHVMERESFEDVATAAIMNEHFINIKIDREERPDLDHIYMDAVQAIAGSGGWPLNVFLTPDGKPFYGGTYFPPQRAYNRPSWQETLLSVIQAFRDKRHEIDAQAENLTEHLLKSNAFGMQKLPGEEVFAEDKPDRAFQAIMQSADKEWGGFGKAPKFPQTLTIQFLLHYGHLKNIEQKSGFSKVSPPAGGGDLEGAGVEALKQALLSLDKMIEGGIYDQVGGGFSRYSTDTEWLAPHFEKMLYDNALLIAVVSEAYQLTKKERYKEVIEETIHFVERELMHPESGFYAALDADSEGVEGKFYVWDIEEVNKILGKDAVLFCECYDITPAGNWSEGTPSEEKKNILRIKKPVEEIAAEKNLIVAELKIVLKKSRQKLIEIRNKRIRPQLDDKIILGWNALMNTACSKAFGATGHETYRQLAISNMQFLLKKLAGENPNEFHHTWKNDKAKYPAFLDDYAFLIEALLQLYEITGNKEWLIKAKELTSFVIGQFSEEETGFFFYTPLGQDDLIIRKKEIYDGAIPSGNSTMAYNLYRLSVLFDQPDWKQRSLNMIAALGKAITQYPTSFGNWVCLLLELITGTNEIVLIGEDLFQIHQELLEQYIPHKVVMLSPAADPVFPLLVDKPVMQTAAIYLCRNYTCHPPVNSAKALISLINNTQNG